MRQKYTILLFLLYSICILSSCTKTGNFGDIDKTALFVKLYGGEEDQTGFDVLQKDDGGYLIVGTTNSFTNSDILIDSLLLADWEDDNIDSLDIRPQEEEWGAYLINTDAEGNELWSVLYGFPQLYVIGSRLATSQTTGNYYILVNYYDKMAIVEVNSLGQTIRKKPIPSEFSWIINRTNGNHRFKGNMQLVMEGNQECLLIVGNIGETENSSLGIIKLNGELDIMWEKKYDVGDDLDNGIDIYPSGDTYVILSVADDVELGLLQITSDGRIIDKREYGHMDNINISDNEPRMIPSMNGGFVILATGEPPSKEGQLRFLDIDNSLGKIDEKCLTPDEEKAKLSARDIKPLLSSDGYIILASKLNENSNQTDQDFYLIKTDLEGNILFSESHGNIENNNPARVIPTKDGGFVLLGTTDFSVNTMISLVKTNPQGKVESN